MLIEKLRQAPRAGEVTLGGMLDAAGQRAFAPFLIVIGLVVVSPLGGVPGIASCAGVASLLVSLQLLVGRTRFWLPRWLLQRRLSADRYTRTLNRLEGSARGIDRVLRPRLTWLLEPPALQIVALASVFAGLVLPFLEAVPFADTLPGVALAALGLGLIARDGVCVLIAATFCASVVMVFGYTTLM